MPNIERYLKHLPAISNLKLAKLLFDKESNDDDTIELIITINNEDVNFKELSSYFDLIYRLDGHLSEIGYLKYVHNPNAQIKIDDVRIGSWEIVIERLLKSIEADKLVIIYIALKYLPNVIQAVVDNVHKYYQVLDLREDFLEKKEKREKRKIIRELINHDSEFTNLEKKQKEKLIAILEELYDKSNAKTVPASRLAQKSIKGIKLKLKKKNDR